MKPTPMLRRLSTPGALALMLSAPLQATTEHDNEVFFAITGVKSFEFTETGHSVSKGQPYSGVTSGVSKDGEEARIVVKAGRHKTKAVAQWFKDAVNAGPGQTLACDSKGNFPDELNFAVEGTLEMQIGDKQITCKDILIAQGSFTTTNNWWMGGPQMQGAHVSLSGATLQTCSAKGSLLPVAVLFSPQTPCANHFNISIGSL
ncbi:hypothetical protein L0E83_14180 [Marichromatium gracile]|uniref:hypothetical protein n=1 Tax=Marichromatium TaxID=85076 RepID=UPI001B1F5FDE|nr:hypothetical protein [Marichromatium gracile]MBO8085400.1 hypothetical protein [Marichromatium sp.]MCF1184577.1 hypothetical protein [Marichromatium gracile]